MRIRPKFHIMKDFPDKGNQLTDQEAENKYIKNLPQFPFLVFRNIFFFKLGPKKKGGESSLVVQWLTPGSHYREPRFGPLSGN